MTLNRFKIPAALMAPATAVLLVASATAATDDGLGALLLDREQNSSVRAMQPTPYMIEDRVVVVGPTMDYDAYETHGGEDIVSRYRKWSFASEREIIEAVKSVYGEDAVDADGGNLPRTIATQLNVGATLPAEAETRPVNDELASRLPEGPEWVALGEHLIALDAYGRIAHVYWDMLPLM